MNTSVSSPNKIRVHPQALAWAWAGYGVCAWALAYTALKLYWAAGGRALLATVGLPEATLQDPWFVLIGLWGTIILGVVAVLFGLATVQSWGLFIPRWLLIADAFAACALFTLRAALGFVQDALLISGIISISDAVDRSVIISHLLLWDPFFLLGAIFFGAVAWSLWRGSREAQR